MRAANVVFETPEGRPIWKLRPLQMLVTLVMVLLTALVGLSLVFTGPVVKDIAGPLGLGDTAVTVWNIAKWPAIIVVVLGMISLLYYVAPNVKQRSFRFVWVWLTNVAILLGLQVNSERERTIELDAGDERADREIQREPRSAPKQQQTT